MIRVGWLSVLFIVVVGTSAGACQSNRPPAVHFARCPTGAAPMLEGTGWQIEHVRVMMAEDVDTLGLPFPGPNAQFHDVSFVKALLQIDPKFIGHRVEIRGERIGGGRPLRVTHADSVVPTEITDQTLRIRALIDNAETGAQFSIPDRHGGQDAWVDIPGYFVFDEPGCFQIWISLDRTEYGPFGALVRTAD